MNFSTEHDEYLYKYLAYFDVYSISFFLVFGSLFNSFYLLVILLARRRSPRIGGKKYLIILTISSFLYLNLHYYVYTLPYIKHLYKIDGTVLSLNFIDSNEYICKLFIYMRLVSRCLFTNSTLGYSLERALAIYFPFKIMIYKDSVSKFIFTSSIIVSFMSPLFSFYFYEIKEDGCQVSENLWNLYTYMLFYLNLITGVLPFILTVFLNVSILIKLSKYEIIVTTLCSRACKTNLKNEIIKILNNIYEENFSLIQEKLIPFNQKLKFRKAFELKQLRVSTKQNREKMENTKYSLLSKVTVERSKSNNLTTSIVTSDAGTSSKKDFSANKRQSFYINHQFPNTNFFIRISLINMALNIPFVFNICVLFNPYLAHRVGDVDAHSRVNPYFFMYLVLTELVYISKYSLTIFFFTFSNVFRFHLNDITKRHSSRILRV